MSKSIFPNENIISKMRDMLSIASDMTRLKIMLSLLDEDKCMCGEGHKHTNCGCCKSRPCMIEKCVSEIVADVAIHRGFLKCETKHVSR